MLCGKKVSIFSKKLPASLNTNIQRTPTPLWVLQNLKGVNAPVTLLLAAEIL